MNGKIKIFCALIFIVGLAAQALAQKLEIRIAKGMTSLDAFPGQMVKFYLEGFDDNPTAIIPNERFQVTVSQGGMNYAAKIRAVTPVRLNTKYYEGLNAGPNKEKNVKTEVNDNQQPPVLTAYQELLFMLPLTLREGEATAVVKYRDKQSEEFQFKIAIKPMTPRIFLGVKTIGRPPNQPLNKSASPMTPIFERGQDEELTLSPLVDPETPDSAVIVTFKQNEIKHEVFAKITRIDPKAGDPNGQMIIGPVRYVVTVVTPLDLVPGTAEVEVRLRANGMVSEPGSMKIEVADFSKAEALKPIVMAIGQSKIGFGQLLTVVVNDIRRLVPNPTETRIILEQNGQRVVLKPERNSAEFLQRQDISMPVLLVVRIGKELTGNVILHVYHPGRGEQAGLSDGVPLEIVSEVLPPNVKKVAESTAQDLTPLRALHQQALKMGREFSAYDPDARYVTIQATGLDMNPKNVRITFSQNGKSITLKMADFSLNTNEQLLVRMPDDLVPGAAQVSIQNIGEGKLSEAVVKEFEVTQPRKR